MTTGHADLCASSDSDGQAMNNQQSITSLPESPNSERRSREIKYTIAMVVRVICFGLIFVVPGWWRVLPALAAVVLPYIAVVIANVGSSTSGTVINPSGRAAISPPVAQTDDES